jgi:hypothetical protein
MREKKKADRKNGGLWGGGVVRTRELKDLYLVRGIGLIITMYRAESKIFL